MFNNAFYWVAHYDDGTILREYDEQGNFNNVGWKDVDVSRLYAFQLVPTREGLSEHILIVTPDIRPIFFRRVAVTVRIGAGDTDKPEEVGRNVLHCLGFQQTFGRGKYKKNFSTYTFFAEDGSSLVTHDEKQVHI